MISFLLENRLYATIQPSHEQALAPRCQKSLQGAKHNLVQLLMTQTDQHNKKIKEWSQLTMGSYGSTLREAVKNLERFDYLVHQSVNTLNDGDGQSWLNTTATRLFKLRENELLLRKAVNEIADTIRTETNLLRQTETTFQDLNSDPHEEAYRQAIVIRLNALTEIKATLEQSLTSLIPIYLQLRNRFDLDYPYLHNSKLILRNQDEEFYAFNGVNQNSTSKGNQWGWYKNLLSSHSVLERIIPFQGISLNRLQKISSESRKSKLTHYVVPHDQWTHLNRALNFWRPIAKDPQKAVGQTVTLVQFPNSNSPREEFKIESYEASTNTFQVYHPAAGFSEIGVHKLIQQQLESHMMEDLILRIQSDMPTLVGVQINNDNRYEPILVTKVSASKKIFYGISAVEGKENLLTGTGAWIDVSRIGGVPTHIDLQNLTMIDFEETRHKTQIGKFLNLNPANGDLDQVSLDVSSTEALNTWFFYTSQVPDKQSSSISLPTLPQKTPPLSSSVLELMDQARLQFENDGYYGERTMAYMRTSQELQEILERGNSYLKKLNTQINDFIAPSLFSRMKNKDEIRKNEYESSLKELPLALNQVQWYLETFPRAQTEATILVREILTSTQRYKEQLPDWLSQKHNDLDLTPIAKSFFEERILLLTSLANKILQKQKTLNTQMEALKQRYQESLALAQSQALDLPGTSYYLSNGNSSLLFNTYLTGGFNKIESVEIRTLFLNPKSQMILTRFFSSEGARIAHDFGIKQEDFSETLKASAELIAWKNYPASNKYAELESEIFANFEREFVSFMNSHGALYNQTSDEMIFHYNTKTHLIYSLTRTGMITETSLKNVPLFWKPYGLKKGAYLHDKYREESVQYHPLVGEGLTVFGDSIYVYRDAHPSIYSPSYIQTQQNAPPELLPH